MTVLYCVYLCYISGTRTFFCMVCNENALCYVVIGIRWL